MPIVPERVYGYGGGLNTNENPASVRVDELSYVRNFTFDQTAAMTSRGGQTRRTTSPADSHSVTWLKAYYDTNGDRHEVFFRNETMYEVSGGDGSAIDSYTYTADTDFTGAVLNDDLYWSNGVDSPDGETMRKWDGSGSASAPTGSPENPCKYLLSSSTAGRMFAAGDSENKERLYFSAVGNPEDWTTANDAGFIDVVTEDGDPITGLAEVRGLLLVFKATSIHVLSGATPQDFTLRQLSTSVGCSAPKSIATNYRTCFFLYNNRVYETEGANIYPVSDRITPTINESQSLANSVGVIFQDSQYWLANQSSGGTVNDQVFVYFFDRPTKDNRRPWSVYDGIYITAADTLDEDSGQLVTGDHDGYLNNQNVGTQDFGSNFTAAAETGWNFIGEPERRKKFKRLWVTAEATGHLELDVFTSYQGFDNTTIEDTLVFDPPGAVWGEFNWGEALWGAGTEFLTQDVILAEQANAIKVRFEQTGPIKIFGHAIMHRKKKIK